MRLQRLFRIASITAATVLALTGPAWAGAINGPLPAPGTLGLVALGVIGAILLSLKRK